MKRVWLGIVGVAALGLAAPAGAADLGLQPYVKAPINQAIFDWSGLYAGINVGGGSSCSSWKLRDVKSDDGGCHDATGATFGGQLGYRWQLHNIVLGVEAQGQWADFSATSTNADGSSFHSRINGFGMFTGQLGYAWNNVLLYVKGGAGVADSKFTMNDGKGSSIYAGNTRWGGTVGVGLEYGFAPDWSVAVEYDHLFLGGRDLTMSGPCGGTANCVAHVSQGIDVGLVRLNYRFGGPILGIY
ncbi:MAG: outer membrane beta-barrel protein [Alphaproteobacteria bacterium]|nr:outer membrane beta-barrel protein [Alphaproteobacteria bacterium]